MCCVRTLIVAVALLFMTACSVPDKPVVKVNASGAESAVTFQWFEYEGRDQLFEPKLPDGFYQNPILAGFYPDPSIVRVDDTFYMVNSSFSYFPGIPIFRSTDLVNWQSLGYVLNRPSQLSVEGAGMSRGIYAPTIRYHQGTFYVITTGVEAGGNFIVTSSDPSGPWSDPYPLPEINGIDPSMFFADNGKVYITHNGSPVGEPLYNGHRAIWMWEFDLNAMAVIDGSGRVVVDGGVDISQQPIWIEGPHLYKVADWYYLLCAEGGTAENHSAVVFRSRSLDGEFVPFEGNPILTQRHLDPQRENPVATTGHADFVQNIDGSWWAVFLATRNYDQRFYNTGRETFLLPVEWHDGWPRILDGDNAVPHRLKAPAKVQRTNNADVMTGNFTWREDFNDTVLSWHWNTLRTGNSRWYSLNAGAGIRMEPQSLTLTDLQQPSFIARRQQHQTYRATTALSLPEVSGVQAGISAFQSERAHYFFFVEKSHEGYRLGLELVDQGVRRMLKTQPLPFAVPVTHIEMEITAEQGRISFSYFHEDGARTVMAENLDATVLSTQRAGGFVGSFVGLHTRMSVGH